MFPGIAYVAPAAGVLAYSSVITAHSCWLRWCGLRPSARNARRLCATHVTSKGVRFRVCLYGDKQATPSKRSCPRAAAPTAARTCAPAITSPRAYYAMPAIATRTKTRKTWSAPNPVTQDAVDSGATDLFGCKADRKFFHNYQPCSGSVITAGGEPVPIVGRGTFRKPYVDSAGIERILEVPDALYCPSMTRTLIGVRCLRDLGHKVVFDNDADDPASEGSIVIRAPDRSVIASFTLQWDGTHYVMPAARTSALSATKAGGNFSTHEIMGHTNHRAINDAIRAGRIVGAPGPSVEHGTCTVCAAAKLHQASCRTSTEYKPTCIGEFIHVDCMTSNVVSSSGYKYILGFVDAKSGATISIKMKKKSDAGQALEL